jgi:hypothetical protein
VAPFVPDFANNSQLPLRSGSLPVLLAKSEIYDEPLGMYSTAAFLA